MPILYILRTSGNQLFFWLFAVASFATCFGLALGQSKPANGSRMVKRISGHLAPRWSFGPTALPKIQSLRPVTRRCQKQTSIYVGRGRVNLAELHEDQALVL